MWALYSEEWLQSNSSNPTLISVIYNFKLEENMEDNCTTKGPQFPVACFIRVHPDDVSVGPAKRVWSSSLLGDRSFGFSSLTQWMFDLQSSSSIEDFSIAAIILWSLWNRRNDVVWKGKQWSDFTVVRRALDSLSQWSAVNLRKETVGMLRAENVDGMRKTAKELRYSMYFLISLVSLNTRGNANAPYLLLAVHNLYEPYFGESMIISHRGALLCVGDCL
ncbi:hypothetical protein LguiA_014208 [Lonicera macranthoides]